MHKKLYEQLDEATARIENIIYIAGMVAGGSLSDPLDDLLDEDDQTLLHCFPDMPDWVKAELDAKRWERDDAFCDWVHQAGKLGYLVKFATPVFSNVDQIGTGSFSWGHYSTRWFYGETIEAAVLLGLAWVSERRTEEFNKSRISAAAAGL